MDEEMVVRLADSSTSLPINQTDKAAVSGWVKQLCWPIMNKA
jgi:hypothetical protein